MPIYGCVEPPNRKFLIALPIALYASTEHRAQEMAREVVESEFPKQFVERHGRRLSAHAVETVAEANFLRRMEYANKRSRETS